MKRYILHIITFLAALLVAQSAWGALSTSGTWNATTIVANETVKLTGNITLNGIIEIASGKLIIEANGGARQIKANKSLNQMFLVTGSGQLEIRGTSSYRITLDGGAVYSGGHPFNSSYQAVPNTGITLQEAIKTDNTILVLEYVTIQNVHGAGNGGAILITGSNTGQTRRTSISNCTIQNCYSIHGSAIHVNRSNGGGADSDKCSVNITNTTIQYCYSKGGDTGGEGGTLRTNGTCVSNINLKNVTMKNNYSGGCGGGVYWNGGGAANTCLTFDGCTFENNVAYSQGGGLMLETTYNFKSDGAVTKVTGNQVLKDGGTGGGIVVTSYGGQGLTASADGRYTFNYDLSDKLEIRNNTASAGAGISFNFATYSLNADWINNNSSNQQVTANINFNGATISGNTASGGVGGGIRLYNNTAGNNGNRKVYINVYLNSGTLSNNTAGTYGGGLYSYKANVNYKASDAGTMTISDNTAISNDGGGIYIDGGTSITMASTVISENTAKNGGALAISASSGNNLSITLGTSTISSNHVTNQGGAIYLPKGNLTISNPTISSNHAATGGAIYIGGGSLTTTGMARIEDNYSTADGGAFYVTGGKVQLASATISGNGKNGSTVTTTNGGAIYVTGSGAGLSATGTVNVSDNAANTNGGALYVNGGSITLVENTFANNNAKVGGAVYQEGGSLTASENSTIQNNYSTADGGAFYVTGGKVQLASATISGNGKNGSTVTTTNGGAIYVTGSGAGLSATGTVNVSDNAANTNGGALYVNGGSITLAENTFANNNAKVGGAVYLTGGGLTASGDSQIKNNYSTAEGGAFYVNGGKVELAGATISGNGKSGSDVKTTDGGAIYVTGSGAGLKSTGTTAISSNASSKNGGAIFVNNGSIELATNSFSGNSAASGGAVYLTTGNIKAGASTIENNYATGNGGAFYVENGNVEVTSATISGNGKNGSAATTDNGGAIYVEGTGAGFKATGDASILSNAAENKGGAIYVKGGNITLAKNTISNNSAVTGGALYVEGGGFSAAGTTEMASNSASENGGAMYVQGGSIEITGQSSTLNLSGNNASNGGVFYVNGGSITANTISKATIADNYSTAEGGAFYVTGGNITLCDTELSGNGKSGADVKTTNGGAIALYNGEFSFGNKSEIKNNAAKNYGGALYVANTDETSISCSGGSYINNTASLGGGIYASGPISLTFAANVRDNIAKNGGGLYLADGVNMSFGNGLIVGNRAEFEQNAARDASQYGVGGGIYLDKGRLSFTATENLGIYNNAASFQAADIYASGSETTIVLPDVKGMNLTGFDVPGSELYWVRDFNSIEIEGVTYGRYEAALRDLTVIIEKMILAFGGATSMNLTDEQCLDLGYDLVFVTLSSTNLDSFDSAGIKISYDRSGTETEYRKVVLMGTDSMKVGLPTGDWKFNVSSWGAKYHPPVITPAPDPESNGYIKITRGENNDIQFNFSKKAEAANVITYDYKKVNKMIPGGSAGNGTN